MVFLLKTWDDMRDYIERFPHMLEIAYMKEGDKIKVVAGKFGCEVVVKSENEMRIIEDYLKSRGAREIVGVMDGETFFSVD